jgi:hypothetical protein
MRGLIEGELFEEDIMPRNTNTTNVNPDPAQVDNTDSTPAVQEQLQEPAGPMIRFVGRDSNGKKVNPPTSLHGVVDILDLPSEAEQRAGFYHDQHHEILRSFPRLYKRVQLNKEGQPEPEPEEETSEEEQREGTNSEVTNNG